MESIESQFRRRAGELYAESAAVAAIAAEAGTPVYIYSAAALRGRFHYLQSAFREALAPLEPFVAYSVKACSNLAILHLLAKEGAAFDVVSGGELLRVVRAGGDPEKIIFAGVGKRDDELDLAVEAGIYQINVESAGEVERLQRMAAARGARARAALRVNPGVEVDTHKHLRTGARASKFGMPAAQAREIMSQRAAYPNIDFAGLHFHVGSMLASVESYLSALARVEELLTLFPAGRIQTIDAGGGLAIERAGAPGLDPRALAAALAPKLLAIGAVPIVEPGRWIAAPSAVLVTKILDCKESGGRALVVADAGMNDLIRPALYDAVHPIELVSQKNGGAPAPADVVGPVCESGDTLAPAAALPPRASGDLLAIFDAGAYGFSMASNYNSRPRPAEVLVDGAAWRVIRARETVDDLWRGEALR